MWHTQITLIRYVVNLRNLLVRVDTACKIYLHVRELFRTVRFLRNKEVIFHSSWRGKCLTVTGNGEIWKTVDNKFITI